MSRQLLKTTRSTLPNFGSGIRNQKPRAPLPFVQRMLHPSLPVLLACLALFAPQAHAKKTNLVIAIRMTADPDHKMVGVPCQVNGDRRQYICLIDSGATNTIVSDRVVKAEGPVIEMSTGSGVVRVHQREVDLTLADGLQLKAKALVQSMMLQGVDILVGQDVLRQFRSIIFDYENGQVEFRR
jgi:hypothetical protein